MKILSLAPCRISLFGSGTDLPEFADKYGGFCLNMAINIRQEFIISNELNYISDHDPFVGKIFDALGELRIGHKQRFDGIITGGIGSSAAATVAIVGAINKMRNLAMTRTDIAELAWKIEVERLGLYGGRQDQYCAAFGGVSGMEFTKDKVVVVSLSRQFLDKLSSSVVLFHLGFNRKNPNIQEGFRKLSQGQVLYLGQIKKLVTEAVPLIGNGDIEAAGHLLHNSWTLKKKSNRGVGNSEFEKVYKKAQELGVWGGKICGAGGGGYCIFMIDPDKRQSLIDGLGIKWIDYDWDFNGLDVRRID